MRGWRERWKTPSLLFVVVWNGGGGEPDLYKCEAGLGGERPPVAPKVSGAEKHGCSHFQRSIRKHSHYSVASPASFTAHNSLVRWRADAKENMKSLPQGSWRITWGALSRKKVETLPQGESSTSYEFVFRVKYIVALFNPRQQVQKTSLLLLAQERKQQQVWNSHFSRISALGYRHPLILCGWLFSKLLQARVAKYWDRTPIPLTTV